MNPRELSAGLASLWRWTIGCTRRPAVGVVADETRAVPSTSQASDEFLAVLSHELRTAVTAALGWTWILRNREVAPSETERAMVTIERDLRALLHIADDLLDVVRIARGELGVEMGTVGLASVVDRGLAALRPAAATGGVALEVDLAARPDVTLGDATRLEQVVWNLVANAIKFTAPGGRVLVRLERRAEGLALVVRDSGVGIAAELLPDVFDGFWRATSPPRRQAGLGLGLAIVRHVVALHGGTVRAESAGVGHGAEFTVLLPFAPADVTAPGAGGERQAGERATFGGVLEGVRILVVDDEPTTREGVVLLLGSAGAIVREAGSVAEGLAAVRAWRPQALVAALAMRGEDGYALLRAVRALPVGEGGATPAVALDARGGRKDRESALSAGFAAQLGTLFDPAELVGAVAGCVRPAGPPSRGGGALRRGILLAEDDPGAREVERAVLEEHGHRVFEAGSGIEALRVWHRHHDEIGVVVTDIMMPHGTGAGLYRALHREHADVPVIVLSGYPLTADLLDAGAEGVVALLEKPVDPPRLVACVERALERRWTLH
ncbi:MAG: response regulator [Candidatus Binatia bacterium]